MSATPLVTRTCTGLQVDCVRHHLPSKDAPATNDQTSADNLPAERPASATSTSSQERKPEKAVPQAEQSRRYVSSACAHCRQAHMGCSDTRPCGQCMRAGMVCTEVETDRRRRQRVVTPAVAAFTSPAATQDWRRSLQAAAEVLRHQELLLALSLSRAPTASSSSASSSDIEVGRGGTLEQVSI